MKSQNIGVVEIQKNLKIAVQNIKDFDGITTEILRSFSKILKI
jgi:hypothetical protein